MKNISKRTPVVQSCVSASPLAAHPLDLLRDRDGEECLEGGEEGRVC